MHNSTISFKEVNPKISIVTVVYNGEKYLQDTINSVASQDYPHIEYIVVDGGSKDKTLSIIEKNKALITRWVSEPDRGLSDAMNKGARMATGDYILFLHADDTFIQPDSLGNLVRSLLASGRNWISAFYIYKNSLNQEVKRDKPAVFSFFDMEIRNVIRHQTTLVPLSIFSSVQFDERYKYAMDYMFFLMVWRKLGKPHFLNEYVAYFRLDGTNLSSNFHASIDDEMKVRKEFRALSSEWYKLPLDYFFYYLRKLKIVYYHSKQKNVI